MHSYQSPSPADGAAGAAEQRWSIEDARLRRQFTIAGLCIAGSVAATYLAASRGELGLARISLVLVLGGMARVIYLIRERYRRFIAIKMAAGLTKEEAVSEFNRRFND
jgi:hypothetical protein